MFCFVIFYLVSVVIYCISDMMINELYIKKLQTTTHLPGNGQKYLVSSIKLEKTCATNFNSNKQ